MAELDGHVTIRFPERLANAVRQRAAGEGMDVSAWVRREVEREISRREGRCASCGQPVAHHPADPAPDMEG